MQFIYIYIYICDDSRGKSIFFFIVISYDNFIIDVSEIFNKTYTYL